MMASPKRALLLLVITLVLSNLSHAQFFKPYKFMMRELIQERRVECMTVHSVRDTGLVRNQELCFDTNGRLIRSVSFWGDPVQTDSTLLYYDAEGNETDHIRLVWMAESFTETGEPVYRRVRAHYRSIYTNGLFTRSEANDDAYYMSRSHHAVMKYDTLGFLVEQTSYDTVAGSSRRHVFINDKDGNEILRLNYEEDGRLSFYEATNYDNRGRKASTLWVNTGKDSDYRYESRFHYDAVGRLTKEERFSGGNMVPRIVEFRYNDHGLIIEVLSPSGNEIIEYTRYP